jgi:hypothetical protein
MNTYSILPATDFAWFSPSDWAVSRFTTLNYQYTGIELSKEISDNEWVLDVGCGINPFKNLIKNLVGIDPIMYQDSLADVITKIEDFNTVQKFDAFFCLGSLNPVSKPILYNQLKKIKSLANDTYRIYVRSFSWEHGIWNSELIDEICKDFSLKCTVFLEDKNISPSMNKNKNSVAKKYFIKLESI